MLYFERSSAKGLATRLFKGLLLLRLATLKSTFLWTESINEVRMPHLEKLTVDDFAPHLGSSFRLQAPEGDLVTITLREATQLGAAAPGWRFLVPLLARRN